MADLMLREAFTSVDENMISLRGSTYAKARRVVLYQQREAEQPVAIATAVIKVAESHQALKALEVPILVVQKSERKRGFGRVFVSALIHVAHQLQCGLLVAWAANNSLGFWQRVGLLEKTGVAASSALRQAIKSYEQSNTCLGFADTRMVATLIKFNDDNDDEEDEES